MIKLTKKMRIRLRMRMRKAVMKRVEKKKTYPTLQILARQRNMNSKNTHS